MFRMQLTLLLFSESGMTVTKFKLNNFPIAYLGVLSGFNLESSRCSPGDFNPPFPAASLSHTKPDSSKKFVKVMSSS